MAYNHTIDDNDFDYNNISSMYNSTSHSYKNGTLTAQIDPMQTVLEQIYSLTPNDFSQFLSSQVMDPGTKKMIVNGFEERLCNRTILSQPYPEDGKFNVLHTRILL